MYSLDIWLLNQYCNSLIVIKTITIKTLDRPSGNQKLHQQQVLVTSHGFAGWLLEVTQSSGC